MFYYVSHMHPNQKYTSDYYDLSKRATQVALSELSTLRDQLRQRDELIKEMVATLKTVNGLVDAHQLNQYIPQGNLDSLIKKSQKL